MKESGIGSQKIIRRKRDGELEYLPDELTIEEPLEIRIGRKPIATTMRTPGHDEELAAGFLLSEGIVRRRDQLVSISVSGANRVVVELTDGLKPKLSSMKRFGTISSSCGLCGKTNIDAIRQNFPAIRSSDIRIDIETLLSLPETLRNAQSDFARALQEQRRSPTDRTRVLRRAVRRRPHDRRVTRSHRERHRGDGSSAGLCRCRISVRPSAGRGGLWRPAGCAGVRGRTRRAHRRRSPAKGRR